MRLLNAVDPTTTSAAVSARNLLSTVINSFATASSTNPANASTRLLILVILLPILTLLPALFTICRAFLKLRRWRATFLDVTCDGLEMGFLACESEGLGEELIRRRLRENGLMQGDAPALQVPMHEGEGEGQEAKPHTVEVVSVFAVPDTRELEALVEERASALDRLERFETKYINVRLALLAPLCGTQLTVTHDRPS